MEVYIQHNDKQLGPMSADQAQSKLKAGEILQTDLAWHEGLEDWTTVGELLDETAGVVASLNTDTSKDITPFKNDRVGSVPTNKQQAKVSEESKRPGIWMMVGGFGWLAAVTVLLMFNPWSKKKDDLIKARESAMVELENQVSKLSSERSQAVESKIASQSQINALHSQLTNAQKETTAFRAELQVISAEKQNLQETFSALQKEFDKLSEPNRQGSPNVSTSPTGPIPPVEGLVNEAPKAPEWMVISPEQAHLTPLNLNLFCMSQLPNFRTKIEFGCDIALGLDLSGDVKRGRELLHYLVAVTELLPEVKPTAGTATSFTPPPAAKTSLLEYILEYTLLAGDLELATTIANRLSNKELLSDIKGFAVSKAQIQKVVDLAMEGEMAKAQQLMQKLLQGKSSSPEESIKEIARRLVKADKKVQARSLFSPLGKEMQDAFPGGKINLNLQESFEFLSQVTDFHEILIMIGDDQTAQFVKKVISHVAAELIKHRDELGKVAGGEQLQSINGFIGLARSLHWAGDEARARLVLEIATENVVVELSGGDHDFDADDAIMGLLEIARVSLELGFPAQAQAAVTNARKKGVNLGLFHPGLLCGMAVYLARSGEVDEAAALYSQALANLHHQVKRDESFGLAAHVPYVQGLFSGFQNFEEELEVLLRDTNGSRTEGQLRQFLLFEKARTTNGAGEWEQWPQALSRADGSVWYFCDYLTLREPMHAPETAIKTAFTEPEKEMARRLVRVIMGAEPQGIKEVDLSTLLAEAPANNQPVPPWAQLIPPDAGLLLKINLGQAMNLWELSFLKPLKELVRGNKSINVNPEEFKLRAIFGGLRGGVREAFNLNLLEADPKGQVAIDRLLAEMDSGLAVGNIEFLDKPSVFWLKALPDEGGVSPFVLAGVIPIKGAGKIKDMLTKISGNPDSGSLFQSFGEYQVIDSATLAKVLGMKEVGGGRVTYLVGVGNDQLVMLGLSQRKVLGEAGANGPSGWDLWTTVEGGPQRVKRLFQQTFVEKPKPQKPNPRHVDLLNQKSLFGFYREGGWINKMGVYVSGNELLPIPNPIGLLANESLIKSAPASVNIEVNPDSILLDNTYYIASLADKISGDLPKGLLSIAPDGASFAGSLSINPPLLKKLVMENLEQEVDENFGDKLGKILDILPGSIVVTGPSLTGQLSEIGKRKPDFAIALQMKPAQSLDDIKNILKIQLGLGALNLQRYGLHVIHEGKLAYICTESIKDKLEAGQKIDLNQGSITRIMKPNQLSLVLDGDMIAGIRPALPVGFYIPGSPTDSIILSLDKVFTQIKLNEGRMTFSDGITFKSGANIIDILSSMIRTWPMPR